MSIQHMQSVFDATGLTSSEKIVLLAYCNYTDPHGYCWPGIDRIADMTGLSRRGVMKIRKQLIERGLLATASRMGSDRIRKTNITRVNLRGLEALRRPERAYADDVAAAELGFKINPAETRSDQQRCTTCTMVDQQRCTTCTYQVNHVHLVGEPRAPYPLEDPLEDPSSSSSGRTETAAPPQPRTPSDEEEKRTVKTKNQDPAEKPNTTAEARALQLIQERLTNAPGGPPTETEARAVITHIRNQATQRGTTIARIDKWIDGRDPDTLRHDLAHIRAQTTHQGPGCGIHRRKTLPCRMCAIAAATGDVEPLLAELKRVGPDERPDLADLCAGHS